MRLPLENEVSARTYLGPGLGDRLDGMQSDRQDKVELLSPTFSGIAVLPLHPRVRQCGVLESAGALERLG